MDDNTLLQQFGLDSEGVVLDDGSLLRLGNIVRVLPTKRLVAQAEWRGKQVYIKVFISQNGLRYANRDASGVAALVSADLPTPFLLYKQVKKPPYLLIYEAIENSENIETIFPTLSKDAQLSLALRLMKVVAQHHNANLMQTDMYLKNFLVQNAKVYTIDGDGIRQYLSLSDRKVASNLYVLLSKFDVLDFQIWLDALVAEYQQYRNKRLLLNSAAIKHQVFLHRKKVADQYANAKVFRQCTDVNVTCSQDVFLVVSSLFKQCSVPNVEQVLHEMVEKGRRLKNGNTCTVALVDSQEIKIVIKRYNIKNWQHRFGRLFRKTRAATSWGNAYRLQMLGIPTARPIALFETRRLGILRGKSYFLSEFVDAPDMVCFFTNTNNKQLRSETVKQIVQLFYRLSLLKISHGDMKASNIKVLPDGKPVLIDLDSMRQHRYDFIAQRNHVRDIRRFMQNWKDTPSLYNAFVKVFKVVYVDHAPLRAAHILE